MTDDTLTTLESNGHPAREEASALHIRSMNLAAFGRFRDIEFDGLNPGLNVIYGRNEAGKSTLYAFLSTMLFGIYPTKPEQHPYAPLDGRNLVGEITYRGQAGQVATVERKLMSSPSGSIVVDGRPDRLGQAAIPEASFLSREVHASVFALTLDDLVAPGRTSAWGEIQDRLTGAVTVDFLRPARDVASELDAEAATLWRDTNRGKPLARQLTDRLSECRSEEREAAARAVRIREITDEITRIEAELKRLGTGKRTIDERLSLARRLVPLRRRLLALDELERQMGDIDRYDMLPDDADSAHEALEVNRRKLDAKLVAVRGRQAQARQVIDAVRDVDGRLVDAKGTIRAWDTRRGAMERDRRRLDELRAEQAGATRDREDAASTLLSSGWRDEIAEDVAALSPADVRAAFGTFDRARQAAEDARRLAQSAGTERRGGDMRGTIGLLVTGSVLLVVGLVLFEVAAIIAGVGLLAWGVVRHLDERAARRDNNDSRVDVDAAVREAEARRKDLVSALNGLDIPAHRLARPDASLPNDVERLVNASKRFLETSRRAVELETSLDRTEAQFEDFLAGLDVGGLPPREAGLDARFESLMRSCDEAAGRIARAESSTHTLEEARAEENDILGEIDECATRLSSLRSGLEELGDGDMARGAARLRERRRARHEARVSEREVRETAGSVEHARDLVRDALDTSPELFEDGCEDRLEGEARQVQSAFVEASRREESLKAELASLLRQPTLADVQSEVESIQEQLHETRMRRDRLALAAAIVRRADARFRAEHQPDVIRRASEYFASMTLGRYDRIMMEGEAVHLRRASDGRTIDLSASEARISRGTRDQLYLAIRLALIDHLDVSHTRLPVFLDEVLVNWDEPRRRGGYGVLEALASRRQVFLFTCHGWLRDEVLEHANAHLITIDSDTE